MSALDTLARLARRRAEDLQRELAVLDGQRRGIEARLIEHDKIVLAEQDLASGIAIAAYGNFAQAAMQRKNALLKEQTRVEGAAEALRATLSEAFIELKKLETLAENQAMREAAEADKREQAELDDVAGAAMARRG
jgi:flagellar export protein FliJ